MNETVQDSGARPQPSAPWGQVIIAILVIGFLFVLISNLSPQSGSSATVRRSVPGSDLAPDFTLSPFEGGKFSTIDLRGSLLVVNLWASWCQPCREEAPALEALWQEYRDKGVKFVGVAVKDTAADAQAFIKEYHLTYPNGLDGDNSISRAYRITGVPETFLIAKDGRLANHYIGPVTAEKVRSALNPLIGR